MMTANGLWRIFFIFLFAVCLVLASVDIARNLQVAAQQAAVVLGWSFLMACVVIFAGVWVQRRGLKKKKNGKEAFFQSRYADLLSSLRSSVHKVAYREFDTAQDACYGQEAFDACALFLKSRPPKMKKQDYNADDVKTHEMLHGFYRSITRLEIKAYLDEIKHIHYRIQSSDLKDRSFYYQELGRALSDSEITVLQEMKVIDPMIDKIMQKVEHSFQQEGEKDARMALP
jgi:hypothetical protein